MAVKQGRTRTTRTLADIVNLIASTRRARGLTQAELAKQVGVSRAWLAAVEGGKPHMDFALILRTLAALDIRLTATTGDRPKAPAPGRSTAATREDIDGIIAKALARHP
ncbi:Helix-turn-helix domain-containing protein [Enhydrobacter aerosaccus]|uniref:Helix-turn-helix domain-containing protein n=1 Tax=Enhydrobacter aerosaccus TaxID=225324 RepID=A0A1T4SRC4_9HYPH|nr:helix-turn-helix domain-containing protein [Enhydrobacter aerosaccus]SKA30830.1 Helix-turn-helix domain-containing protein [Enhydrobacter aerosaccus]